MSENLVVQYNGGFKAKALVRLYTFTVREGAMDPQECTLTIANEAFDAHRVRFQDAAEICSIRLRRELASNENHFAKATYRITDEDLAAYRTAHSSKSARRLSGARIAHND